MTDAEIIATIKGNIHSLMWSMQDAPYHGVTPDTEKGVRFAIRKIIENTELTEESIIYEIRNKKGGD